MALMRKFGLFFLLLAVFMSVGAWLAGSAPVPPEVVSRFEPGVISIENDERTTEIPYRIHRPEGLSPDDPVPLIIFLHGAGSRGDDNRKQLGKLPERWVTESRLGGRHSAVVFVPQCPRGDRWASVTTTSSSGIEAGKERRTDASQPPTVPMQAVMKKIGELVADPSIDASRIYLTGLSMGGFGSWDLVSRHPEWFAAVVPVCGGGDPSFAARIADSGVPIWTVHGDADRVVPADLTRTMVRAIRKADGSIGYTELAGVRHNSWDHAYGPAGPMEWMFAQRHPRPAPPAAPVVVEKAPVDGADDGG
ncbi:MAG: phospholipase [Planctomycetaceae bacterium]|nr:phospholipase [Planctomycetaceae bacterium]